MACNPSVKAKTRLISVSTVIFFNFVLTYDQKAPQCSQRSILELLVKVLPYEHNDAEICVDPVRNEERGKDKEPGGGGSEDTLHLQGQQHREHEQAHQPHPNFKDRDAQPPQEFQLPKQH
jgi:hypothetical protein